mmetsp:Transcript_14042/g.46520  ORF Transcript_14042/g.46520 Transcript_14042/m.46520 type:complete len:225 (-) Transcript_14042:848-1522(-)
MDRGGGEGAGAAEVVFTARVDVYLQFFKQTAPVRDARRAAKRDNQNGSPRWTGSSSTTSLLFCHCFARHPLFEFEVPPLVGFAAARAARRDARGFAHLDELGDFVSIHPRTRELLKVNPQNRRGRFPFPAPPFRCVAYVHPKRVPPVTVKRTPFRPRRLQGNVPGQRNRQTRQAWVCVNPQLVQHSGVPYVLRKSFQRVLGDVQAFQTPRVTKRVRQSHQPIPL